MRTVGIYELKTHLAQLIDEVAQGETITITRHGVPVAEIVPLRARRGQDIAATVEKLRRLQQEVGATLGDLTIREMIEEGRR